MKIICTIFLLIGFTPFTLPAQSHFQWSFETLNSRYVILNSCTFSKTGDLYVIGSEDSSLQLLKLSPEGNVKWRLLLNDSSKMVQGTLIRELSNGNFLFAGHSYPYIVIMGLVSPSGQLLWSKNTGHKTSSVPNSVLPLEGGDFIITFSSLKTKGDFSGRSDPSAQLVRFNPAGEVVWAISIDSLHPNPPVTNLVQVGDYFYWCALAPHQKKLYLLKINSSGNFNKAVYFPAEQFSISSLAKDGNDLILAYTSLAPFAENKELPTDIITLDTALHVTEAKKLHTTGNITISGLRKTNDSFFIAGSTNIFGSYDYFSASFHSGDNKIEAYRFGTDANEVSYARIVAFSGNKYAMAGSSDWRTPFLLVSDIKLEEPSDCGRELKIWAEDAYIDAIPAILKVEAFTGGAWPLTLESDLKLASPKVICFTKNDIELPPLKNFRLIEVTPNPFLEFLQFRFVYQAFPSDLKIELIDGVGRMINVYSPPPGEIFRLNTETLAAGFYYYRITSHGVLIKEGKLIHLVR